jgi:ParB-like chromosome segregation protein Spo0J
MLARQSKNGTEKDRSSRSSSRSISDDGDIDELAESISHYGLINPITVDEHNNLIAGERRLRACRQLEWTVIYARLYRDLTDDEKREIELEENVRRKDLTPIERSKLYVARAETAERVLLSDNKTPNPKGGRPSKGAVSEQAIADHIGADRVTVINAKQHVAAVNRYPELAAPGIPQKEAITVALRASSMQCPRSPTRLPPAARCGLG